MNKFYLTDQGNIFNLAIIIYATKKTELLKIHIIFPNQLTLY